MNRITMKNDNGYYRLKEMTKELAIKYKRYSDLYFKRDCVNEWIVDEKTPEEVEEMLNLRKELQDAGVIPQNDFLAPNHIELMKEIEKEVLI